MSYPIIEKFNRSLISYGDDVVVALSGGADSVCLLYNMLSLWERGYIETLTAVHCNHGLRGEEADRDEKFCKDLCNKLKIHLYCEKIPVTEYAKEHGLSLEEAGRNLRYKTFEKYRMGGKIATAHNKKDNAETVIFNLIRGTSLAGMGGIPIVRDSVIRPLLDVSREEIEEYLKEIDAEFVTDHTNLETKFSRNKIRLSIIPEMESINEGAVNNITAFAKLASYDEEFLSAVADECMEFLRRDESELDLIMENEDRTEAEDIPYAILSRIIKKFLAENGFSADRHRLDTIMDYCNNGEGFMNLSPTATLEIRGYRLIINRKEPMLAPYEITLSEGENITPYKKVTLIYHNTEDNNELVNKKFTNHILDCDKILGTVLTARNRRPSDRIQLVGREFQHRIKKLYENTPAFEKDMKVLIADGQGIIFAEDFGIAERVKIDEKTKRILEIRIEEI